MKKIIICGLIACLANGCSEPIIAEQNTTPIVEQKKPVAPNPKKTFKSELERMNFHHPVDWDRFSGSNKELAYRFYKEKNCFKLQEQFDMYHDAWSNYKRVTGKSPRDTTAWLDHAMWASGCYEGRDLAGHGKE